MSRPNHARLALVVVVVGTWSCGPGGASANPCEVLTAADVAAVLDLDGVRASESPLSGAYRSCRYFVPTVPSPPNHPEDPRNKALDLAISDIETYADVDREARLRHGQSDLDIEGVDRAVVGIGGGGSQLSMVRGNRTATLDLRVDGNASEEGRRKLTELARMVVTQWLDEDAD